MQVCRERAQIKDTKDNTVPTAAGHLSQEPTAEMSRTAHRTRTSSHLMRLLTCSEASDQEEPLKALGEEAKSGGVPPTAEGDGSAGVGKSAERRTKRSFIQKVLASLASRMGDTNAEPAVREPNVEEAAGKQAGSKRHPKKPPRPSVMEPTARILEEPNVKEKKIGVRKCRGNLRKRLIIALMDDGAVAASSEKFGGDVSTAEEAADILRLLRRLNDIVDDSEVVSCVSMVNSQSNRGLELGEVGESSSACQPATIEALPAVTTRAAVAAAAALCANSCGATFVANPTATDEAPYSADATAARERAVLIENVQKQNDNENGRLSEEESPKPRLKHHQAHFGPKISLPPQPPPLAAAPPPRRSTRYRHGFRPYRACNNNSNNYHRNQSNALPVAPTYSRWNLPAPAGYCPTGLVADRQICYCCCQPCEYLKGFPTSCLVLPPVVNHRKPGANNAHYL